MIRKILLFTILTCIALPAHAQTDRYCISSAKLTEMNNEQSTQNPDIQRAYNALFEILVAKNESGTKDNAGCVTQQDLAQICKDALNDDDEMCELFIYAVMTPAKQSAFKILQYSGILNKTNFDDINPDAFKQAVNKTLARRRDKQIPSKLQDMGPAFLENAKLKQIDPFIAASISMYESTSACLPFPSVPRKSCTTTSAKILISISAWTPPSCWVTRKS